MSECNDVVWLVIGVVTTGIPALLNYYEEA